MEVSSRTIRAAMFRRGGFFLPLHEKLHLYVLKAPHERSCAFHLVDGRLRLYPECDEADRVEAKNLQEGVTLEAINVYGRPLEIKRVKKLDRDFLYLRQLMLRSGIPGDAECDGQCYYRQFYARKCRHSLARSKNFEIWRYEPCICHNAAYCFTYCPNCVCITSFAFICSGMSTRPTCPERWSS